MKHRLGIGAILLLSLANSFGCLAGMYYDITGTWNVYFAIHNGASGTGNLTCAGTLESGTVHYVDSLAHIGDGTYTVNGKDVTIQLTGGVPGGSETLSGTFTSEDTVSGTFTCTGGVSGTWTAAR